MMKRIVLLLLIFSQYLLSAQEADRVGELPQIDPKGIREAKPSRLEKDSILIGDQIWWTMPIEAGEGDRITLPEIPNPIIDKVEVLSPFVVDTLFIKKHIARLEARIRLTSFDSGSYALPYLPVYRNGDTLWFKGPLLYVNTIPVDTAGFVPYDLKAQIKYPLGARDIVPWAGILLALGLIVWFIVYCIRRRRRRLPVFGRLKPKEPAHITALKTFDRIKAQKLWQNNRIKLYYTLLTDALRVYFLERWGIQALEQTSGEIIEDLERESKKDALLTPDALSLIENMLLLADMVKFAKHLPIAEENERAMEQAVRFVSATAHLEEEDKKEVGQSVGEGR